MALTDLQTKTLIVDELYRSEEPAFVATIHATREQFKTRVDSYWELYARATTHSTHLGYLYVKRAAVAWLIQAVWTRRNWRAMDRYSYDGTLVKQMETLYAHLTAEIEIFGGVSGTLPLPGESGGIETVVGAIEAGTIGGAAGAVTAPSTLPGPDPAQFPITTSPI